MTEESLPVNIYGNIFRGVYTFFVATTLPRFNIFGALVTAVPIIFFIIVFGGERSCNCGIIFVCDAFVRSTVCRGGDSLPNLTKSYRIVIEADV
jgi:hypothetical protein